MVHIIDLFKIGKMNSKKLELLVKPVAKLLIYIL